MSQPQNNELESRLRNLIIHNAGPNTDSNAFPQLPGMQNVRGPTGPHQTQGTAPNHQPPHNNLHVAQQRSQQQPARNGQSRQQAAYQGSNTPQKFKKWDGWRQEQPAPVTQHHPQQGSPMRSVQRPPRHYPANNQATAPHQPVQQQQPRGPQQQQQRANYHSAPSRFTPLSRSSPQLYNEQFTAQCQYLERVVTRELPHLEMSHEEFQSKDSFRMRLDHSFREALPSYGLAELPKIDLACFGSLASGFGMPGSDMDLVLLASTVDPKLPRAIEKIILDMGHGARLLTRTRVPIIKICEKPSTELYLALREERQKWDDMTPEEREAYDHPPKQEEQAAEGVKADLTGDDAAVEHKEQPVVQNDPPKDPIKDNSVPVAAGQSKKDEGAAVQPHNDISNAEPTALRSGTSNSTSTEAQPVNNPSEAAAPTQAPVEADKAQHAPAISPEKLKTQQQNRKKWVRERKLGPLDFPKDGVGIQCDINFSNNLGLHNTTLLRCYSHCDVRVRLMVLFIKAWASRRKVNSARDGTLSSYGWVLMTLHYLVNVAQPPVCPNLQLARRNEGSGVICDGYDVQFWRNEAEIQQLAAKRMLSHNAQPLGVLLRGFFHYYAHQSYDSPNGGFVWTQQVLSLRTPGGLLTKEEKGWTGAKTMMLHEVEVRSRYLFAIEDPFELDHNVARTVTHMGIVTIRDEFRRAWRILQAIGRAGGEVLTKDGDLMEKLVEHVPDEEEKDMAVDAKSAASGTEIDPQAQPGVSVQPRAEGNELPQTRTE